MSEEKAEEFFFNYWCSPHHSRFMALEEARASAREEQTLEEAVRDALMLAEAVEEEK